MNASGSANQAVGVRILEREYTVGCGPDERDDLMAAAKLLDSKMREIRGRNRMAALDRVAVLAGLNLAHELHLLRTQADGRDRELARTLGELQARLDGVLTPR
ncbi:MAG TPA: cell division protein ZapA [Xanthomonadaceae bacterium]|nr:cell division protein ZapA [Xanthomonadaceae bacterium]